MQGLLRGWPGSPAQTYPSGTYVNYTYDAHGRAYGANTPSGPSYVNSTNYNAAGQIADRQLGNLLTEQNCFNDRFQPTVKRLGSGTSTNCANQAADSLHLAFDYGPMTGNNGNLKQQTITADPTHQWVQYYEYDEVNRLSIAAENAPLPANCTGFTGSWCREFDYDHFGNKATGSNRVMHQAKPTQLSQTDIATNRLTTATYDAAGSMTSHPVLTPGGTITYDANNKKKTFTKTGLSVTTYYDANDRRVCEAKVKGAATNTTIWAYNAFGALVAEYSTDTPTVADGVYYRTTDHLGSTRVVTDDTGQVRQRRDFFPFGEEIPGDFYHGNRNALLDGGFVTYNASLSINQQFTGIERDLDTELDEFLARCFCAPLGMFTSVDPANQGARLYDPRGWNAYGYVFNNPYKWTDPDGRDPCPANSTADTCVNVTGGGSNGIQGPWPLPPGSIIDPQYCDIHGETDPQCDNFIDHTNEPVPPLPPQLPGTKTSSQLNEQLLVSAISSAVSAVTNNTDCRAMFAVDPTVVMAQLLNSCTGSGTCSAGGITIKFEAIGSLSKFNKTGNRNDLPARAQVRGNTITINTLTLGDGSYWNWSAYGKRDR